MKHTLFLLVALPLFLFAQNEKGVNPVKAPPSGGGGATRAVVIGISDYQDAQIPDLRFAHRDAEAFANFLKSSAGGSLDGDHLQVLLNQNATAGRVAEALDALVEQTKEGDEVVIYFSGHGDVERKTVSQPGFLLCWDAPSRVYMGGGTYSLAYLQEIVTTLSTQNKAKVVVVTDACHAGKLAGSQIGGAQLTAASMAKQFSNEVKILSCQPGELSLEGEQWGGGRGVFSFHLIDGLFGLADRNADGQVSLGELDRYLEDKVTAEAAPQSQVPMLLGNKTERLATVNSQILADLKKAKSSGLAVFAATESRGMEDEILEKADSSVRRQYLAFKKAIAEKRFFPGEGNAAAGQSADELYTQLSQNETLAPLRGMIKRNYAAALQDDAQQVMNIWLKADVKELQCIGKSLKLEPIPRHLERAAELLGERHYLYGSLLGRKVLFEGIVLSRKNQNPNEQVARQCLALFRRAQATEPQSPLPWSSMSKVYAANLRQVDSAFACAREAQLLAPNWVLPYTNLANLLSYQFKFKEAEKALREAEKIDPQHPFVLKEWGWWHNQQTGFEHQKAAAEFYEKYQRNGGAMYPCWHHDYGNVLSDLGRTAEAEAEFRKALDMDSTLANTWANLGGFYYVNMRLQEAETALNRAAALDSMLYPIWMMLGQVYGQTGRFAESEAAMLKALRLDSLTYGTWTSLGILYFISGRSAEAERFLKKSHALYPSDPWTLNYLGELTASAGRWSEAEDFFKKTIGLDSAFVRGWNGLAGVLVATGRFSEAEPIARRAIALDSTWAESHRHLGMALFKTGRPAQAVPLLRRAAEIEPTYFLANFGLAAVLAAEGKTAEAFSQVEQGIQRGAPPEALQKDPDLAPLRALPEWKAMMKKHFPLAPLGDKIKD